MTCLPVHLFICVPVRLTFSFLVLRPQGENEVLSFTVSVVVLPSPIPCPFPGARRLPVSPLFSRGQDRPVSLHPALPSHLHPPTTRGFGGRVRQVPLQGLIVPQALRTVRSDPPGQRKDVSLKLDHPRRGSPDVSTGEKTLLSLFLFSLVPHPHLPSLVPPCRHFWSGSRRLHLDSPSHPALPSACVYVPPVQARVGPVPPDPIVPVLRVAALSLSRTPSSSGPPNRVHRVIRT